MVNDEGTLDNFVNALRFGFSNVVSLAIWGICYIVTIALSVFLMVFAVFVFYDQPLFLIVTFLLAFLPALAMSILMLGFNSQCLKTVLAGGDRMPTGLESPGDLVKDGIMTFIIVIEAAVLEFICLAPGFLLFFIARYNDTALIWAGLGLLLLAFPIIFVVLFLNIIQWTVYADTGSLLQGLNPLRPIRLVLSNPIGAALTAIFIVATYLVVAVVGFVCEMTIVGALLIPFLTIAMYACVMYLVATFYRQGRGDRTDDVRGPASAGYSVS